VIDLPIKRHGGKAYLAEKIIALFPQHLHYVEPFAGGLSVLLGKPPIGSEVVNDLDLELTNFWWILQSENLFKEFKRIIEAIPVSQIEFNMAINDDDDDPVDRAVSFFICARQSLAGRMKDFTPLSKNRLRRGMNEQVSAWLTSIDGLHAIHQRLIRVVIYGMDALKLILQEDSYNTFFYLDPPYLPETRTSKEVYKHEMTANQHLDLLNILSKIKGKFLLSGYDSKMYREFEQRNKWLRTEIETPNHAAGGDTKAIMKEILWRNYVR
jgi:DNA adenine methylase